MLHLVVVLRILLVWFGSLFASSIPGIGLLAIGGMGSLQPWTFIAGLGHHGAQVEVFVGANDRSVAGRHLLLLFKFGDDRILNMIHLFKRHVFRDLHALTSDWGRLISDCRSV